MVDLAANPIALALTEGQRSDHIGAKLLYPTLAGRDTQPNKVAKWPILVGDRGYDSDEFRRALWSKKIKACIPAKRNRKRRIKYDKQLYKKRNAVERFFAKIKDWRRIATRYDRNSEIFMGAITLAAIFSTHLKQ